MFLAQLVSELLLMRRPFWLTDCKGKLLQIRARESWVLGDKLSQLGDSYAVYHPQMNVKSSTLLDE